MSAAPINSGQNLYNLYQQTGQVTKKDLINEFDANGDGKITEKFGELGDATEALGEYAAEDVIAHVNDPTISADTNLIEDAFGAADFDPVSAKTLFDGQAQLGIPNE